MEVTIISPFIKKNYSITWLEINTPTGNFVIQDGHVPMIVSLSAGKSITFCLKNGKQETMAVTRGIVEITRTHATFIIAE